MLFINHYQKYAMKTLNPELNKLEQLEESLMGLAGESGEALDIYKKFRFQKHPLDREHLKKELGDIFWYLAEAATALECDLDDIAIANIDKLRERYPNGFEAAKSLNRKEGDI